MGETYTNAEDEYKENGSRVAGIKQSNLTPMTGREKRKKRRKKREPPI